MGYSSSGDRRGSRHSSSSGHRGRSRGRGSATHRSSKTARSRNRPSRREDGRSRSRSRGRPLGSSNSVTDYYSSSHKKGKSLGKKSTRGGRSVTSLRSAGSRSTRSFGSFARGFISKNSKSTKSARPLYDEEDLAAAWRKDQARRTKKYAIDDEETDEETASLDEIISLDAETALQSIEDASEEEESTAEEEKQTEDEPSLASVPVGTPEAYDSESPIALLLFCCGVKDWLYATDMKTTYDMKTTVA
eukprot:scaffold542_cov154-Skeletonema_menzelii.AAC.7